MAAVWLDYIPLLRHKAQAQLADLLRVSRGHMYMVLHRKRVCTEDDKQVILDAEKETLKANYQDRKKVGRLFPWES